MKKILILSLLFALFHLGAMAQKFGYIDSKFILSKMPEHKQANAELGAQSQKWQTEIEALRSEVDKLRKEYMAEEVLLTDDMKKERQAAIAAVEAENHDLTARLQALCRLPHTHVMKAAIGSFRTTFSCKHSCRIFTLSL
jgi:outer membrane protein